jgi:hypothetical protein
MISLMHIPTLLKRRTNLQKVKLKKMLARMGQKIPRKGTVEEKMLNTAKQRIYRLTRDN